MITSLTLRGVLSYGWEPLTLPLQRLNLLIGANASGKSNLLDVLDLLRAIPDDLTQPLARKGGAAAWRHKAATAKPEPTIEYVIEDEQLARPLQHQLRFDESFVLRGETIATRDDHTEEGPFLLLRADEKSLSFKQFSPGAADPELEQLSGEDKTFGRFRWDTIRIDHVQLSAGSSMLSAIAGDRFVPHLTRMATLLRGIQLHQTWAFGPSAAPRQPQPADLPDAALLPDAANLGHVLKRLRQSGDVRTRLRDALRRAYQQVDDVEVSATERVTIYMKEQGYEGVVPASRLSDGTLRWLGLLAILLDPSPPPLVALEEPELGLHPDLIATLAELLREASTRTQLLVTTHSEALVSAFSDHPDDVLVFDRPFEATEARRLPRDTLSGWLQDYRLGHAWMTGALGGRRW